MEYTFELRMCGKQNCDLCPSRNICTPETFDDQTHMLRCLAMCIQDPADEMKFVSPKEGHRMVDEGTALAKQLKSLLVLQEQSTVKRLLNEGKARNDSHGGMVGLWHSSKARGGVAYCSGECAAPRIVYSKFIIDNTNCGEPKDREKPNKSDYNKIKCRIEGGGYMCRKLL
jgi:hypothetical protein